MLLRLILGDQLNYRHSWFSEVREDVLYVFMEMQQETGYVRHHIQKVVGFFLAMRHFAAHLQNAGHRVIYLKIDDPKNKQTLPENLSAIIASQGCSRFEYLEPDEYRLDKQLKAFCRSLKIPFRMCDSEHFLTTRDELAALFRNKKTLVMESFYRHMRKKHHILLDEAGKPLGGSWNYDSNNRESLPESVSIPSPKLFFRDVSELVNVLQKMNIETIGNIRPERFLWPVNREESLQLLDFFIRKCLPVFGRYQDAMQENEWSLFHSRLSFSLNTKMLHPMEVIQKAVEAYRQAPKKYGIAQVEGFVRQILGWREYMRGVYWREMPGYREKNFFEHRRSLPEWFWTGQTRMNCLSQAIRQSLDYAYAHHIQRLMITGNFALLAGIDPYAVDHWYLGIYMDAIEWVEITNTRGMSQFADGGIVGTKPYVSSARYIDKMSNYCSNCHYNKNEKTAPKACPFNSLYWRFYDTHRDKLAGNPRIGMMYRIWEHMDAEDRKSILRQADSYLENIEEL